MREGGRRDRLHTGRGVLHQSDGLASEPDRGGSSTSVNTLNAIELVTLKWLIFMVCEFHLNNTHLRVQKEIHLTSRKIKEYDVSHHAGGVRVWGKL